MKILVIEDRDGDLSSIKETLRDVKYNQIVLSDINLPDDQEINAISSSLAKLIINAIEKRNRLEEQTRLINNIKVSLINISSIVDEIINKEKEFILMED